MFWGVILLKIYSDVREINHEKLSIHCGHVKTKILM